METMVRDRRAAALLVAPTRRRGRRVVNLNSVPIGSEDADRLADHCTKLFGEPDWHEGGFTGWRLGSGWLMVGAHDQVHGRNREPGRLIFDIESADMSGDQARLRAAGATVVREPYRADEAESTRDMDRDACRPRREPPPARQPDVDRQIDPVVTGCAALSSRQASGDCSAAGPGPRVAGHGLGGDAGRRPCRRWPTGSGTVGAPVSPDRHSEDLPWVARPRSVVSLCPLRPVSARPPVE
jgi:hypothetical protein